MKSTFNFKKIVPCLFAVFVDVLGFSLAIPLLTALFTTGEFLPHEMSSHLRYAFLAFGLILYPFFMFFGSSFMGDLSDIIGRKRVLMLCMAGFFIGFSLMGAGVELKSLWALLIGRSLTGLTAASLPVTLAAIADLSTPTTKAKHMSFVVLVQSVGFVLGPLIAGVLSDPKLLAFFNIGIPFFAAGLFSLIAFFWIHFCFKETFISGQGKIRLLRIVTVFIEAMQHPAIRLLTFAFILHQLGIGYFMQLILIYLQQNFQYTSLGMGLFNAFMGIWFALGLLTIPYLSKRYKIEWVACISIGFIGVFVLLLTFAKVEWFVWLITVPLATVLMVAWSAILTSFSQAVDENSQGWALGITGAVVAFSFMLSGFSTDLIPNFGVMRLMIFGGILLLLSAFIMSYYCRHYLAQQPHQ